MKSLFLSQNILSKILESLKSLYGVYVSKSSPAYLKDSQRNTDRILAFNNCLLDFSKIPYVPIKPSADYYFLNRKKYEYDPNAKCPKWIKFLNEIFKSSAKIDPSIKILQEIIGLFLIPETKYQKIFAFVGPKRSGKGTILKVIQKLLGSDVVTTSNLTLLPTQFGMHNLIGKTVAIIPDASLDSKKTNVLRASEILKTISGEDPIEIHRKYKNAKEFVKLPIRFLIVSNTIQSLADPSGALQSRFVYLVTTQSFYGNEDKDLINKLLEELPGIFNWALRGLKRLEKRGHFLESSRGRAAKRKAEEMASVIIAFVSQCCIQKEDAYVEKQELYKSYVQWSKENGIKPMGKIKFYNEFMTVLPAVRSKQRHITVKRFDGVRFTRRARIFLNVKFNKQWRRKVT